MACGATGGGVSVSSRVQRLLLAAPLGWEAPSARYRLGPLAASGRWPIEAVSAGSLPGEEQLDRMLAHADAATALVLQRVLPRPPHLERLRSVFAALIFDFDDAIYATPPYAGDARIREAGKSLVRLVFRGSTRASARRKPLLRVLERVDVAVAGNAVLAEFASRYARRVVEIPTTVRPLAEPSRARRTPPVVVWMGLPDNLRHLEIIREPLQRLRASVDFDVRIVSTRPWPDPPFEVELVQWSEEASREALTTATVGVAPLVDDAWTRGKCALRAIQYAGHGLACVASPVGITDRVVLHGSTGYLARTPDEWAAALGALLTDPQRALEMGDEGLRHVRASYSDDVAVERWSSVLSTV